MSNVRKVTFVPSVGHVVEIPADVRNVQIQRTGGGQYGAGTLRCSVVGFGELREHVVLQADDGAELESGSQCLGVDLAQDDLYYLIPTDAYGEGGGA